MDTTAPRPLLARLNWYWITQLAAWSIVGLFMMSIYSGALHLRGVTLTSWWAALSGSIVTDLWHRLFTRLRWNAPRICWQMLVLPVLVMATLQACSVAAGLNLLQDVPVNGFKWLPTAMLFWSAVFIGWTVCYLLIKAIGRAARYEAEALRLEVSAKEAAA
jgi:hypothetical protein